MNLVQVVVRLLRRTTAHCFFSQATVSLSLVLVFLLEGGCCFGATDTKAQKTTKKATDAATTANATPAAKNTSSSTPVAADAHKPDDSPGADYVPCKLTLAELRMLQRPELAQTLSPAQVEELQSSVVDAAVKRNPDPEMTGPWLSELVEDLGGKDTAAKLTGLAPSQALAVILEIVRKNRENPATAADVAWYAAIIRDAGSSSPDDKPVVTTTSNARSTSQDQKKHQATALAGAATDVPGIIEQVEGLASKNEVRAGLYSKVTDIVLSSKLPVGEASLIIQALKKGKPLDAKDLIDAARQFLLTLERPKDIGCSMSLLTWREVEFAFGYLIANEYIAVQVVVRNLSEKEQFVLHDVEFEVDADPTGRLGRFYSGRDKVVVRALANTQASGDPRNITLNSAMAVGQVMAAAQTVFGGQLADAAGVYNGGFIPGFKNAWKDLSGDQMKMIDDNTFSSTPSSQTVVPKSGTVVFYTFIPSKQFEEGWWTQPCVEMMYEGRLNAGGVLSNLSRGTYGQQSPLPDSDSTATTIKTAPGSAGIPTGVDVRRALEVCARLTNVPERQHSRWSTLWKKGVLQQTPQKDDLSILKVPIEEDPPNETRTIKPVDGTAVQSQNQQQEQRDVQAKCPNNGTAANAGSGGTCPPAPKQVEAPAAGPYYYELFRTAYKKPYKKWSGNSLAIFRELANTVVAGVHTLEDTDALPSISGLDCGTQVDDKGTVDFSKVSGDTLSCTLNGKNLSSLPKVRLRNATDAADAKIADSNVMVVGDPTKATVGWPVATLHGLPGTDYLVFGVTSSSAELKTSAALHLPNEPFAVTVTNASSTGTVFDFSKDAKTPQLLTVTGNHLDVVVGLILSPAVDAKLADQTDEKIAKDAAQEKTATKAPKKAPQPSGSTDQQTSTAREPTKVIKVADTPPKSATQVSFNLTAANLATLKDGGATLTLKAADDTKSQAVDAKLGITVKLTAEKPVAAPATKPDKQKIRGVGSTPAAQHRK